MSVHAPGARVQAHAVRRVAHVREAAVRLGAVHLHVHVARAAPEVRTRVGEQRHVDVDDEHVVAAVERAQHGECLQVRHAVVPQRAEVARAVDGVSDVERHARHLSRPQVDGRLAVDA